MPIYLQYRLERIGLNHLNTVCIYHATSQDWIFHDIADEFQALYPEILVWPVDKPLQHKCELAIIPYFSSREPLTLRSLKTITRQILPFEPDYLGFYEFEQRHLVMIQRTALPFYFTRIVFEQMLVCTHEYFRKCRGKIRRIMQNILQRLQ